MELQEVVRTAGSCRFFLPDPVPDEVLAKLLDAARFAPQGGNRQPVRWIVVRDPSAKKQLPCPRWCSPSATASRCSPATECARDPRGRA
jgi:nitroreductase